jgi:hypothetical protein
LVRYDGAGSFTGVTVTNHNVLIGAASNGITSLALTNGQLAIGSTGADPSAATLTAGTGVSITNGAGSITISAGTGGLTWSVITADQTVVVGNGYICNKGSVLTLTLPASPSVGDFFAVTGINTALGWKIGQPATQQIFMGTSSTTVGTGGSLASINIRDTLSLVCVVAGTAAVWQVISSMGNVTVV